ncbi:MAG: septal ring lytic transglycosylase RlpA family protein [Candidatus Binatia bacterium]
MNVSLGLVRGLVLGLALARTEIALCQEAETDNAPAPLEELEKTSEPAPSDQTGLAAFYHATLQGRRTANGESFDHNGLTAAHKTLPFGTLVRVINLRNYKSVIVRVNDRGPKQPGRVIDLTHRAARILGFMQKGMAKVVLEILPPGAAGK